MKDNNIKNDSQPFTWDNAYLHAILTQSRNCIIKNDDLVRAFNLIDRVDFVPHEFQHIAHMDYDIDIGYGCTLHKPTIIAQILQILNPKAKKNVKVLDVGTGSGYVAALLAIACGDDSTIISLERVQFLTDIARINLGKYPEIKNVKVYLRDGSQGLKEQASFDYIHISASFENIPEELAYQLKVGGKMVVPTTDKQIHLIKRVSNTEFKETIHNLFDFSQIKTGIE